jgi:uncharacterized membrane protein HdeD (DUF308 family)
MFNNFTPSWWYENTDGPWNSWKIWPMVGIVSLLIGLFALIMYFLSSTFAQVILITYAISLILVGVAKQPWIRIKQITPMLPAIWFFYWIIPIPMVIGSASLVTLLMLILIINGIKKIQSYLSWRKRYQEHRKGHLRVFFIKR